MFQSALQNRCDEIQYNTLSNINVLGLVNTTSESLISNGAIHRNSIKWIGLSVDYPNAVNDIKRYHEDRLGWIQLLGHFDF